MSPLWIIGCVLLCLGSATGQQVTCQIDLAILLDRSGSIKDAEGGMENWYKTTNFTKDVIDQFVTDTIDSHIALVTFGNNERIYTNLVPGKSEILAALGQIQKIVPNDNTNTSSGIYVSIHDIFTNNGNAAGGDRPRVPNVVILITDGVPTYGLNKKTVDAGDNIKQEVINLAQQLKQKALLIAIGVTNKVDKVLMDTVATSPNNSIAVSDFSVLRDELDPLIRSTCQSITTPKPTEAPKPCRQDSDIYFLIDSSGSISEANYKKMIQYVANVIQELPVGQGTRVGILYYSRNELMGFDLKKFTSAADAIKATLALQYIRNTTNTAATIRFMRQQGFTSGFGDRSGVPNIGVILTDGNSNVQRDQTLREAFLAKTQGIHMISMGVGTWINQYELQSLASDPYSQNYIQVSNTDDFTNSPSLVRRLVNLLCNEVDDCNSVTCLCGGTCVDKIGSFSCQCPGTCSGVRCERECSQTMDVVFAVDSSGSLQAKDFRMELDFVRDAVKGLNIRRGDRVGLERFSTDAFVRFQLNTFNSMDAVLNGITLHFDDKETNTEKALNMARTNMFTSGNGDTSGNNNILVILTDGRSKSYKVTWEAARLARQAGITVISVGIGQNLRIAELQAMASGSGNTNVFTVNNFNSLSSVSNDVINAICNNRGECETMNCQNGATQVDRIGYCMCQCPQPSVSNPGFSGQFCERRCSGRVDIALIVDSSGSIRRERMKDILKFIADFVRAYPVFNNMARFGAIYFSDGATKAFGLNTYSLQEDIITAIENIPFMGQRTNIADALRIARNDMFSTGNGGRNNADKYVIIFTDGKSNINAQNTIPNAINVRENTAKIIVVGIGNDADTLELRGMASAPTDKMMMMAPSFRAITQDGNLRNQLLNSLINAPCDTINRCDNRPCARGNCVNDLHDYFCECPQQYGGKNCDRECRAQLDLALVLDFSASLDIVYNTVIAFAKEIVMGIPAGTDIRVAVVDYDTNARVHFNLNTYTNKQSIMNAMSFGQKDTRTNTQEALNLLTSQIFTGNGDRSGAKNVAIVVTDGGSNIQESQTIPRADQARAAGIELFVAAFGNYQMSEINGIANNPDSTHVVTIGMNTNNVQQAANQMLNLICQL